MSVCPFSDKIENETEIGKQLYGELPVNYNEYTGYYLKNYAGYVKESEYRKMGSSGGMGNWIASQLLKLNLVDGIIHVKSSNRNDESPMFKYQISYTEKELVQGAKSKYYPVEMSEVIKLVKENEGRFALIGIPCFIKSIRLLANQDQIIKNRIKFCIGLVCGHLKSDMFAKSIGWQMGIPPKDLKSIDFRKKLEDRPANEYGVEVKGIVNDIEVEESLPTKQLYTTNWGYGLFKYNACEFCDDVVAETADITVGDAWLPEYKKESMGTNVIIVRNPIINDIIKKNSDNIHIEEISTEKIYDSQASGFRHRREGLSYRLYLKDKNKEWRPVKRIEPSSKIKFKRKKVYEKRLVLTRESFRAFKKAELENDFKVFIDHMNPYIKEYKKTVAQPLIKRVVRKANNVVKKYYKISQVNGKK